MKYYSILFGLFCLGNLLSGQHQVTVLLKDGETDEPIPFGAIEVHETSQVTLAGVNGICVLDMQSGRYHLHVEASGYQAIDKDVLIEKDTSFQMMMYPTFVELMEVLVEEGMTKTSGKKLTQDVERINIDDGNKAQAATLAESLSKVAGVNAYNTGVGIAKPIIRGFTATRISVYDQGVKQEGQQWGMDHGLEIDPFSAGRMEILKGAGALQYGSDALGGVVRLLPDAVPDDGFSGNVSGVYKNNNQTKGSSLLLNYKKGKSFVGLRLSGQQYNDFRVPATEFTYNGFNLPITDNTLKNTAGNLFSSRLNYGFIGDKFNLRVLGSYYDQNAGLYPGATGIPRAYDVGDIGDVSDIDLPYQSVKHYKLYSSLNFKIKNNWLTTDMGYQYNRRREHSNPHAHGFQEIEENNTVALGLDLKTYSLNSSYNWIVNSINYTIGVNQTYQVNRRSGWEYLLPDFETYNGGAFLMLKGDIGERWSWSGGARFDYAYHHSEEYYQPWFNNPDSLVERSPELTRNFSNYAASFGMSYVATENWNFKWNLAKSFRVPVPAELVSNGVHHGTFRHEVGNPDLDAEEGYQLDLAAIFQRKAIYVKLTPFVNYFSNYVYLRPSGRFSPLPDAGQLYIYSQAEALHTGGELFAEIHPVERLHVSTSLEYVYNLNLETNLPLPFTPPLSNLLSMEYELVKTRKFDWEVGAEYRITAAQNRVDRNEPETPGYNLFNLKSALDIKLGQNELQLSIGVLNIFDTAYLSHLSRYRILNLPEQGRNLVIGLNFRF